MTGETLLDPKVLRNKSIPILCNDEKWQKFSALFSDEDLEEIAQRQLEMVKEEKEAQYLLVQLMRSKREVLNELLGLTEELQKQKPEADQKADRLKSVLERINDEVDKTQFVTENSPKEINGLNMEMLELTARLAYDKLTEDWERIEQAKIQIDALRAQLKVLYEERFSLEETATELLQYIHSLLGKEQADLLDSRYLAKYQEIEE